MTDRKELENLMAAMRDHGATCTPTIDANGWIDQIQITNAKGIGPYPMSPISAAERMREWLWGIRQA